MQASDENKLNPDRDFHLEAEIRHLKFTEKSQDAYVKLDEVEDKLHNLAFGDCDKEDQEEEDEFSFNCGELNTSPIAAEDAFINGQIKPVFPLFDPNLLFPGNGSNYLQEKLPVKPPVKNFFVEMDEVNNGQAMTSDGPESDEIVGPYCEWSSRKVVEASPDQFCKKSNSTGFSKIWRFKEFVGRCNSDGRDAFVFLNNGVHAPPPPRFNQAAVEEKTAKTESTAVKIKKEVKKSGKSSKTAQVSAHGAYLRSKAKEDGRRRSYLPYRPELMGFFTNVNGGLTKNVHPF